MAKRTRIIEGTWNCTSCDAKKILARHKRCPSCKNPRELTGKESEFDFGDVDHASGKFLREGVTDEKALDLAGAGADWFCSFCEASNRGDGKQCSHCGAERDSDAKEAQADPDEDEKPSEEAPAPRRFSRKTMFLVVGALFSCCFGSCLFSQWARATHEEDAEVARSTWQQVIIRERFTPTTREDWQGNLRLTAAVMPVNGTGEVPGVADIRACTRKQRTTRRVADGTERVCSSKTRRVACGTEEKCTRRSKGNGFSEEVCHDVTKYCSESYQDCHDETRYRTEPVMDIACTYDTHEWTQVDRSETSGSTEEPRWPEVTQGPLERLRREGTYSVTLRYAQGKKEYELTPKSEAEYLQWRKAPGARVTVTNMGKALSAVPR
ncbi:hypothetical protein JGU66_02790 [Myxococcaceae bacterium JPH2]|nr:hypothetical protein [Myxococcaceae bacterium JPH2]